MQTVIVGWAQTLVDQGRYTTLASWRDYLPEEYTERHPWLLFRRGIALMTVDPHESSPFCARAYRLFKDNEDIIGQVLSWSSTLFQDPPILRVWYMRGLNRYCWCP